MSAAAISWVIACGLLCGGVGVLAAAPAAAEPGTVGNSDREHRAHRGSDSNARQPRDGRRGHHGPLQPSAERLLPGTVRPDGGVAPGSRRVAEPVVQIPRAAWHPTHNGDHSGWPCLHFLALPPFGFPLPPLSLPPPQWPHNPLDDGVGIAAPPRLRIASPPEAAGGGSSGGLIDAAPRTPPPPGVPGEPAEPPVISAERGAVGPTGLEPAPITMPPLIGLPPAFPAPLRPAGPAAEPVPRGGPGRESATVRERPPATSAGAGAEGPASSRVGYPQYLRDAKIGEVAAVALPGFAGLLVLTGLGGILGYRQAKAGHVVRVAGTTRFMQ